MSENKSKVEPWQLILILVIILAFFGGLYVMNQALSERLDALDRAVGATADSVRLMGDRIDSKFARLENKASKLASASEPAVASEPTAVKKEDEKKEEKPEEEAAEDKEEES